MLKRIIPVYLNSNNGRLTNRVGGLLSLIFSFLLAYLTITESMNFYTHRMVAMTFDSRENLNSFELKFFFMFNRSYESEIKYDEELLEHCETSTIAEFGVQYSTNTTYLCVKPDLELFLLTSPSESTLYYFSFSSMMRKLWADDLNHRIVVKYVCFNRTSLMLETQVQIIEGMLNSQTIIYFNFTQYVVDDNYVHNFYKTYQSAFINNAVTTNYYFSEIIYFLNANSVETCILKSNKLPKLVSKIFGYLSPVALIFYCISAILSEYSFRCSILNSVMTPLERSELAVTLKMPAAELSEYHTFLNFLSYHFYLTSNLKSKYRLIRRAIFIKASLEQLNFCLPGNWGTTNTAQKVLKSIDIFGAPRSILYKSKATYSNKVTNLFYLVRTILILAALILINMDIANKSNLSLNLSSKLISDPGNTAEQNLQLMSSIDVPVCFIFDESIFSNTIIISLDESFEINFDSYKPCNETELVLFKIPSDSNQSRNAICFNLKNIAINSTNLSPLFIRSSSLYNSGKLIIILAFVQLDISDLNESKNFELISYSVNINFLVYSIISNMVYKLYDDDLCSWSLLSCSTTSYFLTFSDQTMTQSLISNITSINFNIQKDAIRIQRTKSKITELYTNNAIVITLILLIFRTIHSYVIEYFLRIELHNYIKYASKVAVAKKHNEFARTFSLNQSERSSFHLNESISLYRPTIYGLIKEACSISSLDWKIINDNCKKLLSVERLMNRQELESGQRFKSKSHLNCLSSFDFITPNNSFFTVNLSRKQKTECGGVLSIIHFFLFTIYIVIKLSKIFDYSIAIISIGETVEYHTEDVPFMLRISKKLYLYQIDNLLLKYFVPKCHDSDFEAFQVYEKNYVFDFTRYEYLCSTKVVDYFNKITFQSPNAFSNDDLKFQVRIVYSSFKRDNNILYKEYKLESKEFSFNTQESLYVMITIIKHNVVLDTNLLYSLKSYLFCYEIVEFKYVSFKTDKTGFIIYVSFFDQGNTTSYTYTKLPSFFFEAFSFFKLVYFILKTINSYYSQYSLKKHLFITFKNLLNFEGLDSLPLMIRAQQLKEKKFLHYLRKMSFWNYLKHKLFKDHHIKLIESKTLELISIEHLSCNSVKEPLAN